MEGLTTKTLGEHVKASATCEGNGDTPAWETHKLGGKNSKGLMCVSKKQNAPHNPASSTTIVTTITMMVESTEVGTT